jgi:hypothetical protein
VFRIGPVQPDECREIVIPMCAHTSPRSVITKRDLRAQARRSQYREPITRRALSIR